MLCCSSRMKTDSSSQVNMYRRTWQSLETASFFPLGSHLYCTAKRRISAVFSCKESIAGPRQIPATPLLCLMRYLCCYKSEAFWFVMSYVASCVKGHCFWFSVCEIQCMDYCQERWWVDMLCPAAGEDSRAWPGLRLRAVLPTAGAPSCPALLWLYSLVGCVGRRRLGCVLGGTKKPLSGRM